MTIKGVQAWVTSAVDDTAATRALVLAASLRRVRTAKKLAVLTTSAVAKNLREKLEEVFDLVLLLEQTTLNGLKLEEYAKIQALSLLVFSKCVYLAPQTLVLKNCDEIFDKHGSFAICGGENGDVDTSVFMFTPSIRLRRALEKIVHGKSHSDDGNQAAGGYFSSCFKMWMKNHIPKLEQLGREYNVKLGLNTRSEECIDDVVMIANFVDAYPLDCPDEKPNLGAVSKFAVDACWLLYNEQVSPPKDTLNFELSAERPHSSYETEPIAIVGLDFRFPGANNPAEFWDLLENGKEGIIQLPPHRWTKEQICLPCQTRKVEAGFLNFPIDEFDSKFFGLSPKDAPFLDPQQRLLHEVSWCALEDAGIDPLSLHATKTGIFVGSWIHDYKEHAARGAEGEFLRVYMGNSIAATSARLSHFLGTTGPSIATESGCSSGIVGIDMGIKSLKNHDSDLAIACAVNLLIHPFDPKLLGLVFSPSSRCKTFDASADGFGRAEGCAVLVMKRLSDAVREGNKVWGLIRGSAVTQEGTSKSFGTPTVHSESLAMKLALEDAGVEPKDVTFVETHGTGTQVGDPLEAAAVAKAYSNGRSDPLIIGSVKTNLGHTESVSGHAGIIKVLLSLKHEMIPAHLNFETLNPNINLDAIPAKIPLENIPWPRQSDKPRLAGVSSFGISGGDGHVIIEEAPRLPKAEIDFKLERPLHVMKISAKSEESFQKLIQTYERLFREKAEKNEDGFADVAHSANTGRSTFNHRALIVAKDFSQAAETLKSNSFKQADIQTPSSPICFLFTGQGSQYPNMASSLYQTSPVFRTHFDKCAEVLQTRYNIPIKQVLWGSATDSEKLSRTLYSQTSIFCVEYCLLKLWESWGVKPDYVLGHSLGEFAAAVAAGALGFEDALMLVAERSRLIDSLPRGKMLVIRGDKKTVDHHIAKYKEAHPEFWADYAALNSPDQTVIAGDPTMIEDFAKFCEEKSLKAMVLAATHAFHSRLMDPMLEEYRQIASSNVIRPVSEDAPKYISGMEGMLTSAREINADYWVRHTREKVSFMDACKAVHSEGCTLFLEVGPHPILSALAMMNMEGTSVKCLPSLRRKEEEWVTILDSLSKLYLSDWKGEINWKGFDRLYPRKKVDIPFYQFNRKANWIKTTHIIYDLHPLLGRVFLNASNQTIFERQLTVKGTNFVQDHVIGTTIVFPGAGFLEMALSGGYASVQGLTEEWTTPRRPIGITNLTISAPLALYDSGPAVLQTVVTLDNKGEGEQLDYSVSIHRNNDPDNDCGGQWVLHASATFQPVSKINVDLLQPVNVEEIINSWERYELKEFYEKLPEVGLRFGPKFQSLQLGWRSESAILTQVKVPEESDSHLVHPVVGDAMLQASMFWMNKDKDPTLKKKLQVPLRIGEFIWLSSSTSSGRYIYCSTNDEGHPYALLVDDEGIPLAYMADIDFAETTVKLIEGMIQQQTSAMPTLWEEIWKPSTGPLQNQLPLEKVDYPTTASEEIEKRLREKSDMGDAERNFSRNILDITHSYVLEALLKLGWKPEMATPFTVDNLLKTLSIKSNFKMYIRFYLRSIALQGGDMLEMLSEDGSAFRFKIKPPTMEELVERRVSCENAIDRSRVEYRLIAEVGKVLHKLFNGDADSLSVLFPDDPSKPSAKEVYAFVSGQLKDVMGLALNTFAWTPVVNAGVAELEQNSRMSVARILEVGAGTGAFTRHLLSVLGENNVKFEYWYTDVSAAFFKGAEKEFSEHLSSIVFKKFDMEEDPFEQGLCPEYFDMVLCCEVLHIAKDTEKTLKNLYPLLKPGGTIQILETIGEDPRLTLLFGLLDGYWRFEDYHLRPFHISIPGEKWVQLLSAARFPKVVWRPAYDGMHGCFVGYKSTEQLEEEEEAHPLLELREPKHVWLIFDDDTELTQQLREKLVRINRKVVIFSRPLEYNEESLKEQLISVFKGISESSLRFEGILYLWSLTGENCDRDQSRISLPLLTLHQLVLSYCEKAPPRMYSLTQGAYPVGESEVLNPSCGTVRGVLLATANEDIHLPTMQMDLSPSCSRLAQAEEIFQNLWVDRSQCFAFREGKRYVPKLSSLRLHDDSLPLPSGCTRFQLQLPESKLISDLEFVFLEPFTLGENEIEVQTKAFALNFRDLFAVLKPQTDVFDNFNSVGLDYSGVVTRTGSKVTKWKVGDRMMSMDSEDKYSLASHMKLEETSGFPIPANMTYAEGSTLPAVFLTTYLSFVDVAKLKRGETVLIHTGSGGVGLCAIQLAQYIGANIITTAGSPRKRNYLRNLGIKHVFHSRTTEFSKKILEVTKGRGVDVVLNSLTGPGFKEASLDCLTKFGRFVELSKMNVWQPEEVEKLRPDVLYSIIDFAKLTKEDWNRLTDAFDKELKSEFKPIPYDRFDAVNIRSALSYLQKAKHIGKIVCVMPEVKLEQSKLVATTPLFNEDSTYIITGGLGGIGFEVVKWMLASGAKHVAIAGRSPPNEERRNIIESWTKSGKHVQAFSVDVGDYEECRQLIEDVKSSSSGFPQIRGVMHAAGVLRDATVDNQSWESFHHSYQPKISGSWNLHDLTKELMLEHFVLFSSVASVFGSPGQSNHSASNSFEDTLAHYRNSIGLPATSVNWGNWGEVGVATEIDFPGIRPISTSQGLLALETFLKTQRTQTLVANIDSFALMSTLFPQLKNYVEDKRLLGETRTNVTMNSDEFWAKVDAAEEREDKIQVFKDFIKSAIRTLLRMDATEEIDDNVDFQSIGVDSLMMLEMKNGMQNVLGARLTLTIAQLKDCTTTNLLSNRLMDILEGEEDKKNVPSQEELKILIREDSQLPEHILAPAEATYPGVDQIRTILMTGLTGNMGPYFLRDLSQRESIDKVYCLIRKSGKESPANRLHSRLKKSQLLDEVNMDKVECIQGDITNPLFGLGEELYGELAGSVDAIFHNAVKSDHTCKYWAAPPSRKSHVRNANVFGTRNVLEFAALTKVKQVYFASTLITVTDTDANDHLSEEWQDVGAFDDLPVNAGYPISKHICEQLFKQAIANGIPCKVFRLPMVGGDSRTGRCDYETSHLLLRSLGIMKLGCMPDIPGPVVLLTVDKCVSTSLSAFFDERARSDVYHVCKRNFEVDQILVDIAKDFGIQIDIVSYSEFVEKLKSIDDNSPLAPFAKMYQEEEESVLENAQTPSAKCAQKYLENSKDFFTNTKLSELFPNFDNGLESSSVILRRDLHFLEKSGVFKMFGIGTSSQA